jgi:hypothetical protein
MNSKRLKDAGSEISIESFVESVELTTADISLVYACKGVEQKILKILEGEAASLL